MARAYEQMAGDAAVTAARVVIDEPLHLCRVQTVTRSLCRSAGFNEADVFQAVIAVTELAYALHLERSRRVDLKLSVLRRKNGLELRAEDGNCAIRVPVQVGIACPGPAVPGKVGRA